MALVMKTVELWTSLASSAVKYANRWAILRRALSPVAWTFVFLLLFAAAVTGLAYALSQFWPALRWIQAIGLIYLILLPEPLFRAIRAAMGIEDAPSKSKGPALSRGATGPFSGLN